MYACVDLEHVKAVEMGLAKLAPLWAEDESWDFFDEWDTRPVANFIGPDETFTLGGCTVNAREYLRFGRELAVSDVEPLDAISWNGGDYRASSSMCAAERVRRMRDPYGLALDMVERVIDGTDTDLCFLLARLVSERLAQMVAAKSA